MQFGVGALPLHAIVTGRKVATDRYRSNRLLEVTDEAGKRLASASLSIAR
jgi:hypothetical protein